MKKFYTIIALCMLSVAAMAQYSFAVKAGFNTTLGLNREWKYDDTSFKINNTETYGFNVGLMGRFGYRAFAQVEAVYHFETSLSNIARAVTFKPVDKVVDHWINIPVMFGFRIIQQKNFNWYLLAGPAFNFQLSNKTTEYTDEDGETITATPRPVTFGLDCGTGFDIWIFTLEVRYKLMQNSSVYKDGTVIINTDINKNPEHAFEVGLAVRFVDLMNK